MRLTDRERLWLASEGPERRKKGGRTPKNNGSTAEVKERGKTVFTQLAPSSSSSPLPARSLWPAAAVIDMQQKAGRGQRVRPGAESGVIRGGRRKTRPPPTLPPASSFGGGGGRCLGQKVRCAAKCNTEWASLGLLQSSLGEERGLRARD